MEHKRGFCLPTIVISLTRLQLGGQRPKVAARRYRYARRLRLDPVYAVCAFVWDSVDRHNRAVGERGGWAPPLLYPQEIQVFCFFCSQEEVLA
jgi:hypothetical protein